MGKLSIEQSLAFLQKKSTSNGDSVFSHLAQLIQTIVESQPENAIDILETSLLLKQTRFIPDEGPKVPKTWKDHKDEKAVKEFIGLFSRPEKPPPDPEAEEAPPEEEEEEPEYTLENLYSDSAFFEAVGVGLGRTETYLVILTLKQLGGTKLVSKARFFGKFFGIRSNYYVFETTSEELAEEEPAEGEEEGGKKAPWGRPVETVPAEKGIGPNAHTYWVCSKPGGPLYRLPDVTPGQIKTARQIKKFFTGDLKAEVSAYPPFPGVEENYLRAQIARISATTHVVPKGFYKLPEEGEEGGDVQLNEEYEPIPPAELMLLENWVHRNKYLNLQGRTTLFVAEKEEGEEGEEGEEEKEEKPPSPEEEEVLPEPLSQLDTDAEISEGWKPWSLITSSAHKGLKHQVMSLRSEIWPGACAVVTPTGFSNIYIGWGAKNRDFVAPFPPPVLKEFEAPLVECLELPPIPKPPEPEKADGEEEGGEGD